jgi:uncharacterized protein YydD (DUF2326 family)
LAPEELGFNSNDVFEKYEREEEYKQQENFIEESKNKFAINSEEIDKIRGIIEIREQEKSEMQNLIDEFNFYIEERNISAKIIDDIETKISEKNTNEYNLKYELEKIRESIKSQVTFDLEAVKQLFDEVNIYFPDQQKKVTLTCLTLIIKLLQKEINIFRKD